MKGSLEDPFLSVPGWLQTANNRAHMKRTPTKRTTQSIETFTLRNLRPSVLSVAHRFVSGCCYSIVDLRKDIPQFWHQVHVLQSIPNKRWIKWGPALRLQKWQGVKAPEAPT